MRATGCLQMTWRLLGQEPVEVPGGRVRIVDSTNFHAASTIAAALVELDPGAMRELHWHPTNDEWQYYISGQAKMTVFASSGKARTFGQRRRQVVAPGSGSTASGPGPRRPLSSAPFSGTGCSVTRIATHRSCR